MPIKRMVGDGEDELERALLEAFSEESDSH